MSEGPAEEFVSIPSGRRICFRQSGTGPAVLLISGLGEDLTFWSRSFVEAVAAQGFRVIVMDNRDAGRSTFADTPPPGLLRQVLARPRGDGYTLADMAGDCVAVLDHLGIAQAHLVGRSMGGMIAQTVAATEPARVLSLTSIYSTTGARKVGGPAASTIRLLAAPAAKTRTAHVTAHLRLTAHIAGRAHPIDDVTEAEIAAIGWDRAQGDLAAGSARQIQAIQRSGDRTEQLRTIAAPTLVIHGDRDPMVHPSGGAATAAAIPGARHLVIPGMGHHIPASLERRLIDHIAQHAHHAEQGETHDADA
ncbi:alpha/beta fold hydrolase [Dermacoccaceae bacterium W4C1]